MPYAAPRHKQNTNSLFRREDRMRYDQKRGTSAERGYDGTWQRNRKAFLQQYPLCADCAKNGRYVQASDVHHILKAADHPDQFWNADFWLALCHSCHAKRTANGE